MILITCNFWPFLEVCENSGKISDEACNSLRRESPRNPQGLDYCFVDGYVDRMREMCYKTCGYCRAPAPPKCSLSKYGCCWDQVTIKVDGEGSNCDSKYYVTSMTIFFP